MVAHTGTTRVRVDPTDALPGGDAPPIPAHLHDRLLSDLCHPGSSLCSVAHAHRLSVSELALWLTEPETRAKMLAIEQGGYAHTRMAAAVTLSSTVNVLHTIIEDYAQARARERALAALEHYPPGAAHTPSRDESRTPSRIPSHASLHDDDVPPSQSQAHADSHTVAHSDRASLPAEAILADNSYRMQRLEVRRAEGVRRAAHHLYRLSRIVPVDDTKLARATGCLSASANDGASNHVDTRATSCTVGGPTSGNHDSRPTGSEPRTSVRAVSDGTASVSERTSSEPATRSEPRASARAVSDGTATVRERTSFSDANSPRVACLHEVQACSEVHIAAQDSHGCASAAMPPDLHAPAPDDSAPPTPSRCHSVTASRSPSRGPPP